MALVGPELKAKMQVRIYAGLERVFASDTDSRVKEQWMKIADAISDIALDVVTDIQDNAVVITPTGNGTIK